jgi:MFS family permease
MFFAFRVLLGAADQVDTPIGSSLLADWYPPAPAGEPTASSEPPTSSACPPASSSAGRSRSSTAGAARSSRWRSPACSWRSCAGGCASRSAARATRAVRAPPPTNLRVSERFSLLLRIPTVRVLLVGLPALWLGFGGIQFWMPTFLVRSHGLGEAAAAGMAGGIGGFAIMVGTAIGSVIGDRGHLQRRGWRMRVGGTGLLLGTLLVVVSVLTPALGPRLGAYALATSSCPRRSRT